jgi:hypothetical protein
MILIGSINNVMNNILWTPIDLPKCPIIPELLPSINWHFWEFAKLTINNSNPYDVSDFTYDIKEKYPDLVAWFQLFPYVTIRNIKLNHQLQPVKAHIDFTRPELDPILHKNNVDNEPCGYRVLLRGSRKEKLYMVYNDEKIYCEMPDDTDVYILNHTAGLHGVEDDKDRWTFFTHLEIDPKKHKLLLEKSLQKYSSYAIIR